MTLRRYLNLMTICTSLNWLIWLLVIFFVNPEKTGLLGLILFYVSLFLAILGTGSILGFIIGARLKKRPVFVEADISFRRAFLIAIFVISVLFLKGIDLFYWWNTLLLGLFLIILEFFFVSISRKYEREL
ncbi:hypothetical protein COW09_02340 [bacterium (Candidatus Moisslbacteria) CG12_big_fil_rev_8_21_14_0_65_36_11]|nr:hypothetical protein [Candidatus Kuenenbacteria bacterium]PIV46010.1 MAG: hypothetical protein COS23_01470 [bacterium (Candidatus Moisslbacteria) CG02_land_8_20_14_3_00_36_53]PIW67628.1 MAG: hypothetical protein COW09_02340 [bacterium (Candidatus Moisslbacteria) CG12_big_fil_rev_8_21_14_0_65_36_11]